MNKYTVSTGSSQDSQDWLEKNTSASRSKDSGSLKVQCEEVVD